MIPSEKSEEPKTAGEFTQLALRQCQEDAVEAQNLLLRWCKQRHDVLWLMTEGNLPRIIGDQISRSRHTDRVNLKSSVRNNPPKESNVSNITKGQAYQKPKNFDEQGWKQSKRNVMERNWWRWVLPNINKPLDKARAEDLQASIAYCGKQIKGYNQNVEFMTRILSKIAKDKTVVMCLQHSEIDQIAGEAFTESGDE